MILSARIKFFMRGVFLFAFFNSVFSIVCLAAFFARALLSERELMKSILFYGSRCSF